MFSYSLPFDWEQSLGNLDLETSMDVMQCWKRTSWFAMFLDRDDEMRIWKVSFAVRLVELASAPACLSPPSLTAFLRRLGLAKRSCTLLSRRPEQSTWSEIENSETLTRPFFSDSVNPAEKRGRCRQMPSRSRNFSWWKTYVQSCKQISWYTPVGVI